VLQAIGSALMLGGSFTTQGYAGKGKKTAAAPISTVPSREALAAAEPKPKPTFQPRVFSGYIFGLGAAMCYGIATDGPPGLLARAWRQHGGRRLPRLYGGDVFFSLILHKPSAWGDIKCLKRENLPWFLSSAVLVAVSQPSSTPRLPWRR